MTAPTTAPEPAASGSGPEVLVVEDDEGIATQLVRGLTRGRLPGRARDDGREGARARRAGRRPARPGAPRWGRRDRLPEAPRAVVRRDHRRDRVRRRESSG